MTESNAARDARYASYGVQQDNPLWMAGDFSDVDHKRTVKLSDKSLVKILRLRLLTDPGYPHWEVSYCWGLLADGSKVCVDLGNDHIRKGKRGVPSRAHLVDLAREAGRFAAGLGLLDTDVISTLR